MLHYKRKTPDFAVFLGLLVFFSAFQSIAQGLPAVRNLLSTYQDSKSYKDLSWLTAHNAFSNHEDGWIYAQQAMSISHQFEYGVRSFMVDLHWYDPDGKPSATSYLALCHDRCTKSLVSGFTSLTPPTKVFDFFVQVATLLRNNPQDIITLHFESYSQSLGRPLTHSGWRALQRLFKASGLIAYLSTISPNDSKLTLGYMRANNKRLVVFSDRRADTIDPSSPQNSTGIFHTTEYMETEYNLRAFSQCEIRKDNRALIPTNLFVMNHFHRASYVGSSKDYNQMNDYSRIAARVNLCRSQNGIFPNFIPVDFVEEGRFGGAREAIVAINQAVDRGASSIPIGSYQMLQRAVSGSGIALLNPWLHYAGITISSLCALGSYQYPWLTWCAAIFGSTTSVSLLHEYTTISEDVPAVYAPAVYAAGGIVLFSALYHWHPIYLMIASAK
jgi:hypothetical protein